MNPETPRKHSVLYRLAHDEWCSHDEADDGVPCDCHLSMIASLRQRLEEAERALRMAQAFVDAPTKFGIRHKAYMQMRNALAALAGEE